MPHNTVDRFPPTPRTSLRKFSAQFVPSKACLFSTSCMHLGRNYNRHPQHLLKCFPRRSSYSTTLILKHQVPEEIAALSELRVLAVDNNEIKTLPASIGKLSRLQSLLLRCVGSLPSVTFTPLNCQMIGRARTAVRGMVDAMHFC